MIRHRVSSALCVGLALVLGAGLASAADSVGTVGTVKSSASKPAIGLLWSAIGEESTVSVGSRFVLTGTVDPSSSEEVVLLPLYITAGDAAPAVNEQASITEVALAPIWPNPNHGEASMNFALPKSSIVHLTIHDVQGRQIAVLANGTYGAGRHDVTWHANQARGGVSAGIYFVRLQTADRSLTRRMVVTQ